MLSANQKDSSEILLIRFVPLSETKDTFTYHIPKYTTKEQDKKALFFRILPGFFPGFLADFLPEFLSGFFSGILPGYGQVLFWSTNDLDFVAKCYKKSYFLSIL